MKNETDWLVHHGVKGMRWHFRKARNKSDNSFMKTRKKTLTPEQKKKRAKAIIAGAAALGISAALVTRKIKSNNARKIAEQKKRAEKIAKLTKKLDKRTVYSMSDGYGNSMTGYRGNVDNIKRKIAALM